MSKRCPGCGATAAPEARFCRLCGTPLHAARAREGETPVSPLAQTIPLTGEGRSTDGLGHEEAARRPAAETSRVGRAEMDDLLRRASAPADVKPDGDGDGPAPLKNGAQTTALKADGVAPDPAPAASEDAPAAASNTRSRRRWQAAAVVLLCVALVATVLAFVLSRGSGPTAEDGSSPISISDQQQLVSEKLAEAETLLASGEFNRAITVLRAAAKLSPANAEVRMRLGNALERTGARDEAIAEYKAASESSPENEAAWRALASAQFEEKLYSEAADSYERVLTLGGTGEWDAETQLAHAESLRLAGRVDEARAAYQSLYRMYGSTSTEVARTARARLAELGPAPSPTAGAVQQERPRAEAQEEEEERGTEVASATSTPTPPPAPTVAPTQTPAAASAEPRVDYDSYYFQAVNVVNGRDPRQIERAELLRALALFQKAALGGSHRIDAQRYADRLGKEYDRRRKQG